MTKRQRLLPATTLLPKQINLRISKEAGRVPAAPAQSIVARNIVDRSIVDRSIVDRSIVDRSIVDRNIVVLVPISLAVDHSTLVLNMVDRNPWIGGLRNWNASWRALCVNCVS